MHTPVPLPGGDLEHAVLAVVYELDRATAREIHERVGEPRGLIYTTTAKVLDRLHAKGLVKRRKEGQAFVYTADRKREVVERARIRDLLSRMLKPTPKPAMAALVDAVESLDPDLVDELARLVAARRRSRGGS